MVRRMAVIAILLLLRARSVYKPHSVKHWHSQCSVDHLSGLQVSLQLKQPTRNSTRTSRSRPIANNEICPCLALLLVGVAWPPTLLLTPVVSYNVIAEQSRTNSTSELAHLCTLTRLNKFSWAVCFCGPVRQVSPPRVLPDTMPCGVRTFLSPTNWAAATRPTW